MTQEAIDLLHNALNLNAGAEQQVATSLRWSRLQLHDFARVAGGIRVRDILPHHLQANLCGLQRTVCQLNGAN